MMKAVIQREYGSPDVLKLGEVSVPTVKDREVLIRVRAASVQAAALPSSPLPALQGLCDKGDLQPGQKVLINELEGLDC